RLLGRGRALSRARRRAEDPDAAGGPRADLAVRGRDRGPRVHQRWVRRLRVRPPRVRSPHVREDAGDERTLRLAGDLARGRLSRQSPPPRLPRSTPFASERKSRAVLRQITSAAIT